MVGTQALASLGILDHDVAETIDVARSPEMTVFSDLSVVQPQYGADFSTGSGVSDVQSTSSMFSSSTK